MSARGSGSGPYTILVVDDNPAIHRDFQKILSGSQPDATLEQLDEALFGAPPAPVRGKQYVLSFADNGQDALQLVKRAKQRNEPFTMAFVDMRMPGWDGIETVTQLLMVQPDLHVAICSAYMDYSWHDVLQRLKRPGLRLLRKPWSGGEVLALVHEFCERKAPESTRLQPAPRNG